MKPSRANELQTSGESRFEIRESGPDVTMQRFSDLTALPDDL